MLALATRSDAVQVCRARVRGAADGMLARRRLERALSDIAPSSLGLTQQALLIVRRVAPATRLRLGTHQSAAAFLRGVRADLERHVRQACRPWLEGDTAAAEAVLFADESELAACLLRDRSRGVLTERWWWPAVLRGLSPPQWWRRHLLGRGDLLPAVLAQLTSRGVAVAWLAHLSEGEASQATAAVIAAHAPMLLPHRSGSDRPDDEPAAVHALAREPAASATRQEHAKRRHLAHGAASSARQLLLTRVPELRAANLAPAQQRLFALALCLQRASAWTRSPEFAFALWSLEVEPVLAIEELTERSPAAPIEAASVGVRPREHLGPKAVPIVPHADDVSAAGTAAPARGGAASACHPVEHAPPAQPVWSPAPAVRILETGIAREGSQPGVARLARRHDASAARDSRAAPASTEVRPIVPASSAAAVRPAAAIDGVETQFGGIFYLLNVALALGLYGDFTMPRAPGIALSPWDWLALIGRTWLGREVERDPVWTLLAGLAGRAPNEPPGQNFDPAGTWTLPAEWLAPWGAVTELAVQTVRGRLQLWHRAGFVVMDVPLVRAGTPLVQARLLCRQHEALRDARLVRLRRAPPRRALHTLRRRRLAHWLRWIVPYLTARLARALATEDLPAVAALVCRHPARLFCTATNLDVRLSLTTLPVVLRIAGLDRDPGWIPAAGRTVAFHFE